MVGRGLVVNAVLLQQILSLTKLLLPLSLFPLQAFDGEIDSAEIELRVLDVEGNVLELGVEILESLLRLVFGRDHRRRRLVHVEGQILDPNLVRRHFLVQGLKTLSVIRLALGESRGRRGKLC